MEFIHQYIIKDGTQVKNYEPEKKGEIFIYEVLRIIDGVPLFAEKHAQRLKNSAELLKKDLPFSGNELINLLEVTIQLNGITEGNIKIILEYGENNTVLQYHIGYIPHSYPTPETYRIGVKTITVKTQRNNPSAKVQNDHQRKEINKQIKEQDAYEAILVHPEGFITEGSRSNIFFIKGDEIFTAPDNLVLSGITRENILSICQENNFTIKFEPIGFDEINKFDAAFLTGTSPKVLAINSINSAHFKLPHSMIEDISKKYEKLISDYITYNKK